MSISESCDFEGDVFQQLLLCWTSETIKETCEVHGYAALYYFVGMETVFIGSYYAAQSNYIFLGRQLSTCPLAHVPPPLFLPTRLPPHVTKTSAVVSKVVSLLYFSNSVLSRWSDMSVVKAVWQFLCTWPCVYCSQVIFLGCRFSCQVSAVVRNGLLVSENEKYRKCCFHCKKNKLDKELNKASPCTCRVSKLQLWK